MRQVVGVTVALWFIGLGAAVVFGYQLRLVVGAVRRRVLLAKVRRAAPELFDQDAEGWRL